MSEIDRFGQPTQEGQRAYSINRLKAGSSRFGPCEVCGNHCDTTYYQVEAVAFNLRGALKWTRHQCRNLFGHSDCLEGVRQAAA